MKPPRFRYHDPATLDELLDALAEFGPDGKILSGGQSLVPLLNFRLASPEHLIDINRALELDYLRAENGALVVGAGTRQVTFEHAPEVARLPMLAEAIRWVGHPQVRHRGTVCGSIAHADAAAELPAAFIALDGSAVIASKQGRRTVPLREFFLDYLTPDLEPDELLLEVRFPLPPAGSTGAFVEFARRHGDYAIVGVAVQLELEGGACRQASIVLSGVGATPIIAEEGARRLAGEQPDAALLDEVARVVAVETDPVTTIHGTAEYRRHLAEALTRRALATAFERAGQRINP